MIQNGAYSGIISSKLYKIIIGQSFGSSAWNLLPIEGPNQQTFLLTLFEGYDQNTLKKKNPADSDLSEQQGTQGDKRSRMKAQGHSHQYLLCE